MDTKTWTFIDKNEWPAGPWGTEPDKMQWPDSATGLPCLVVRNRMGAWCGYVGVSQSHPWFDIDWQKLPDYGPEVHGGLTFSSRCDGSEHGICHVVPPNEDDAVWWFGFDCGHMNDMLPSMIQMHEEFDRRHPEFGGVHMYEHYWTLDEVRAEVALLAEQLAAVK